MKNSDKSIVILSGGMDSVTTLAYASNKGFKNYCITFNYGQKSYSEINSAKYYANYYDCLDHKIFEINFDLFTESSLISENINFQNIFYKILIIVFFIIITFEPYLLAGYQEYLIFSTLIIAARYISFFNFNNARNYKFIFLILTILYLNCWFKDEGVVYFIILTPISLLVRMFGKDLLGLKFSKNLNSYWITRKKKIGTMDKQF